MSALDNNAPDSGTVNAGKSYGSTYSGKEMAGYLTGLVGQNIIYNIINSGWDHFIHYVIYIPSKAILVFQSLARIWDAINDPMMGSVVDKTRTKWGKCKPYLMFVPPLICLITILNFVNGSYTESVAEGGSGMGIIIWCAVAYILWGMSYTIGDIPLWGVTSLMTEKEKDRSKILSMARVFSMLGAVGMMTPYLGQALANVTPDMTPVEQAAAYRHGFLLSAVILTVFSTVLFEFSGLSVHERVSQSKKSYTLKENFRTMATCEPFRRLLISGILRSPNALLQTAAIPLVTYYFFRGDIMTAISEGFSVKMIVTLLLLVVGIIGGMIVGSIMTPGIAEKTGKKRLYNVYSLLGAVPYALLFVLYLLTGGDVKSSMFIVIVLALLMFCAAWTMGGLNVLQSVMIADCIDYEEYNRGVRTDGVFFSGQSFITKLNSGIGSILTNAVFGFVGWTDANIEAANNALKSGQDFLSIEGGKYAMMFFFLISIPPAIGMALSAIPTLRYKLTDKEHQRILDALIERRAEKKTAEETAVSED